MGRFVRVGAVAASAATRSWSGRDRSETTSGTVFVAPIVGAAGVTDGDAVTASSRAVARRTCRCTAPAVGCAAMLTTPQRRAESADVRAGVAVPPECVVRCEAGNASGVVTASGRRTWSATMRGLDATAVLTGVASAAEATTDAASRRLTAVEVTEAFTARRTDAPPATVDADAERSASERVTERPTVADATTDDGCDGVCCRRAATVCASELTLPTPASLRG